MTDVRPQAIRVAKGISVRQAAREIGVCPQTVERYEAEPAYVKTPKLRWLLDAWYQDIRDSILRNSERRRRAETDDVPESVAA